MPYALLLCCLLVLPLLATAAPPPGLLPGPVPRAWQTARAQRYEARVVRREARRERRWQRRTWPHYERPAWRQDRTIRRHGERYQLVPVPPHRDTR